MFWKACVEPGGFRIEWNHERFELSECVSNLNDRSQGPVFGIVAEEDRDRVKRVAEEPGKGQEADAGGRLIYPFAAEECQKVFPD